MNGKVTSYAFIVAVVFHAVIAFVVGIYLVTQAERVRDLIGIEVLRAKVPPKPVIGKPVVKPVIKPTIATRNTVTGQVQIHPRVSTIIVQKSSFQPEAVIKIFKPNHQSRRSN